MEKDMKKLICFLFGHKYRLYQNITQTIREVKCVRCKKMFGMNDNTQSLLPMDDELIVLHKALKIDNQTTT